MKSIRGAGLILLFLICAISSRAQPSTVQQLQNGQLTAQQQMPLPGLRTGTNATELYPGENADVGPQHILRMNPRPKYFDVFLDSQVYFSDNPTYSQSEHGIQSYVFVNTIQAAITPPPMNLGPGKIAPYAGFASQWYNYDNNAIASLDFNAQTAFAGTKYSWEKWLATVNFNYTRLLSQGENELTYQAIFPSAQTYEEFLPSLALQRFFVINDKMLLALGDQVDYHVTDSPALTAGNFTKATSLNDHFDNIIFVTFNYQITTHLAFQPFYRFQYSYYRRNSENTGNRDDCLHALGITMLYNFNEYFSARVFVNYNRLHSTDPANLSYGELNGGIGASLDIKF